MPTLADIYSAINTAKRKASDFVQNPGTSLEQMLGDANDRARNFNQLGRQSSDAMMGAIKSGQPMGQDPATQQLMDTMTSAYNPVGMIGKSLSAKYPNVTLDVFESPEAIDLSRIVVPKEMRGQGLGSNVMRDLIDYADQSGKQVRLSPTSDFGGSPTRLKKFYKEFGFVDNRGRNKDFTTRETMIRNPQIQEAEDISYRGSHTAPGPDFGAPLHDLTGGGQMYPADIYSPNAAQYYGAGQTYDQKAFSIAQQFKNKPNATVTIYRAVPSEKSNSEKFADLERNMAAYMRRGLLPQDAHTSNGSQWYEWAHGEREKLRNLADEPLAITNNINAGDWVTLTKEYAKDHGESALKGKYKIISKKVKAKDVWTNADSIHEFGYHPE
jgi:GNAT superfamily N-acetyltransferase